MRTSYKTKRNSKSLKRIKKNRSKRRHSKTQKGGTILQGTNPFGNNSSPSKKITTTYQSVSLDELKGQYEKLFRKYQELYDVTQEINKNMDGILKHSEYKDVPENIKTEIQKSKELSNIHIVHGSNSDFDRTELKRLGIVGDGGEELKGFNE